PKTYENKDGLNIRVAIIVGSSDIPATRKLFGHGSAVMKCHRCPKRSRYSETFKKTHYGGMQDYEQWLSEQADPQLHREYAQEWLRCSYPNSNQQIELELMKIVLKNSLVNYHLSCQWTSGLLKKSLQFLALKKAAGNLAVTNEFDREELQYFISLRHDTSNKIYGTENISGRMLAPSYKK
ncbi:24705_t:CDS:2, partial [Dentiscutata erythropus]